MRSSWQDNQAGRRTGAIAILVARHVLPFRRFLITGCLNAAVSFLLYQIVLLIAPYWLAFSISYVAGMVFSWSVNSVYSFSVRPQVRRILPYAAVSIANYFIGLQILTWLVETIGVHEVVAPLIVIALLVPLSYVGTRMALLGDRAADGRERRQ